MKLDNPKSVKSAAEIMKQFNLNPLEELARLTVVAKARGDDLAVENISKFLMPYMYPKQKYVSVDVTPVNDAYVSRLTRGRERVSQGITLTHDEKNISFL